MVWPGDLDMLLGAAAAHAGVVATARITRIEAQASGRFFLYLSAPISGSPSCASQPANVFVIDGKKDGGRVVEAGYQGLTFRIHRAFNALAFETTTALPLGRINQAAMSGSAESSVELQCTALPIAPTSPLSTRLDWTFCTVGVLALPQPGPW